MKTLNYLKNQSKLPDYKADAEKCIKVFGWLKDNNPNGAVWSSQWEPLVKVSYVGDKWPKQRVYKLTLMGETLLKGIESEKEH